MNALCYILVVVVACALATSVQADPFDMLSSRDGKTFAYSWKYEPSGSTNSTFNGFGNYGMEENMVIWTQNMNTAISSMIQTYMSQVPEANQVTFSTCYKSSADSSNCVSAPKAFLRIAKVSDCPFENSVCCPLYWVTNEQIYYNLSIKDVDVKTILWNGKKSMNNFFTNFSASTLSEECALPAQEEAGKKEDFATWVAVDANGEWAPVSPDTIYVLKELNITSNASEMSSAVNVFGDQPSKMLARSEPVYFMATPIIAIGVTSGVIGLVLIMLILFTWSECSFVSKLKRWRNEERSNMLKASSNLSVARKQSKRKAGNPFL